MANTVSLEGFIIANIFHQALLRRKTDITNESIIDALESLGPLDIGLGVDIYYDKSDHQAIHIVWMTSIDLRRLDAFVRICCSQK